MQCARAWAPLAESPLQCQGGFVGTQNLGGAGLAAGLAVLGGEHWRTFGEDLGIPHNSN